MLCGKLYSPLIMLIKAAFVISPGIDEKNIMFTKESNESTEEGKKIKPEYTRDHPSVNRTDVHKYVADMALKFFNQTLP